MKRPWPRSGDARSGMRRCWPAASRLWPRRSRRWPDQSCARRRATPSMRPGCRAPSGPGDRRRPRRWWSPPARFRTAEFRRATLADAVADALRWLDAQPPSRREIHFSGAFRRGAIGEGDLLLVPPGVRHPDYSWNARRRKTRPDVQTRPRLTRREGMLVRIDQQVRLDADATRVDEGASRPVSADRVRIMAAPAEQPLADAALGAALDAGVAWTTDDRPLVIVWEGARCSGDDACGCRRGLRMPVPSSRCRRPRRRSGTRSRVRCRRRSPTPC